MVHENGALWLKNEILKLWNILFLQPNLIENLLMTSWILYDQKMLHKCDQKKATDTNF